MGLFQITMYGVGLILGAGIYVLIGEAAGIAGDTVWISFVLAAIVAVIAGLSYAELVSVFPKAAAEYTFVKNSFKSNFLGFIVGWLTSVTSIITAAVVALGFGGYFAEFVNLPIVFAAIFLIGALSIINFFGIRESSWTNILFTLVEVVGLLIIIYIGFTFATPESVNYFESPTGISGIAIAFVLVFFAFVGFEDMANVAEEVKRPSRTIPRAIVLSVAISGVLYVLVSLSVVRVVNWQDLGVSAAPLAAVAERAFGVGGHTLLSLIALFATTNTVLIILIAGARMLYGMARDHSLPALLGKIHFKTKTPWIAVIGIMLASMAFAIVGDIVLVANISVFAIVITFGMVNLSVIFLRYTEPTIERPFRVPLNIGKFPILPLVGLGLSVYMGFQFELPVLAVGGVIIGVGVLFYFVYNKKKKTLSGI